jgi:NAD+ kinase
MLNGCVYRNGKTIYEDIALNDIVLSRFGNLGIIDFKVYVNDEYLNLYSADGMIVATPTGSTAYNLSAGGPILEPCAGIMVITPICSHTLGSRSIVLSADSKVTVEIGSNRHSDDNEARVYFDGSNAFTLMEGDVIEINKSKLTTKIMKLNSMSFVEVLHKKMN